MIGQLYVISAPSGTGKTSLVQALVQQVPGLRVSVSHTTRAPRAGEADGVDYHFTDVARFRQMVDAGRMLEYAQVYEHFYGTSQDWVEEQLAAGTDVILEIDWQGAQQIRKLRAGVLSIFILPPSLETLRRRLEGRAQDSAQVIARRMSKALEELSHYAEYDYLVVNDDFDQALAGLAAIVRARRLHIDMQSKSLSDLLARLMA